MATVAPVDFKKVVEAFNQSGYPEENYGQKLELNGANYDAKVKLELVNTEWTTVQDSASASFRHTKQVTLKASDNVTTKITASSDVPGSSITIVSGFVKGISSKTATAEFQMPPELGGGLMSLDLTKQQQNFVPQQANVNSATLQGKGNVEVKSSPTVYQGAFTAEAQLAGDVMFNKLQVPIQLMAEEAQKKGCLQKPFSYSNDKLCWSVHGNLDYLVESVTLVKKGKGSPAQH